MAQCAKRNGQMVRWELQVHQGGSLNGQGKCSKGGYSRAADVTLNSFWCISAQFRHDWVQMTGRKQKHRPTEIMHRGEESRWKIAVLGKGGSVWAEVLYVQEKTLRKERGSWQQTGETKPEALKASRKFTWMPSRGLRSHLGAPLLPTFMSACMNIGCCSWLSRLGVHLSKPEAPKESSQSYYLWSIKWRLHLGSPACQASVSCAGFAAWAIWLFGVEPSDLCAVATCSCRHCTCILACICRVHKLGAQRCYNVE